MSFSSGSEWPKGFTEIKKNESLEIVYFRKSVTILCGMENLPWGYLASMLVAMGHGVGVREQRSETVKSALGTDSEVLA